MDLSQGRLYQLSWKTLVSSSSGLRIVENFKKKKVHAVNLVSNNTCYDGPSNIHHIIVMIVDNNTIVHFISDKFVLIYSVAYCEV